MGRLAPNPGGVGEARRPADRAGPPRPVRSAPHPVSRCWTETRRTPADVFLSRAAPQHDRTQAFPIHLIKHRGRVAGA